jgi:hypothetical protein
MRKWIEQWRIRTWFGRWRWWIVRPLRAITGIERRWIARQEAEPRDD